MRQSYANTFVSRARVRRWGSWPEARRSDGTIADGSRSVASVAALCNFRAARTVLGAGIVYVLPRGG
jgi:hypothetical protein